MDIAIIGAGKLGIKICDALTGGDYAITVIDTNSELLDRISQQFDVLTANIDARDIAEMRALNIGAFSFLIATTGNDEINMVTGRIAVELGCGNVIIRVREPEYMKHFEFLQKTFGFHHIVNPDMSITNEIYKYLVEKYTLNNGVYTSGSIGIIEFKTDRKRELIGKKMQELKYIIPGMLVVAISRNGKVIVPHGGDSIRDGDSLYVAGERSQILELNNKVHEKRKYTNIRNVMIIGGGKTGYYLGEKLSQFGAAVKIIEKSKERCQYLATRMHNVMILHGDGTDIELLDEENLSEMDAFVTATGYDEQNLLLALAAKQRGVEDVISKISRESYSDMIADMGVDMVLNPLDIIASRIANIIQGSQTVRSSVLIQGQAEIVEIRASKGMFLLDGTLNDLEIPTGMLVAAIYRDNKVIIPDGNARVEEGDRVLIFTLLTEIANLENLLRIS